MSANNSTLLDFRGSFVVLDDENAYEASKSIAFRPDGQYLASGHYEDNKVWLWNVADSTPQIAHDDAFAFSQTVAATREKRFSIRKFYGEPLPLSL